MNSFWFIVLVSGYRDKCQRLSGMDVPFIVILIRRNARNKKTLSPYHKTINQKQ
jgi:hypothetical protein